MGIDRVANVNLVDGVSPLHASVPASRVQSNFWAWDGASDGGLDFSAQTDPFYTLIHSLSQNNHIAMEGGTIIGVNVKFVGVSMIEGFGVVVLRATGGSHEFSIVGVSNEFTSANFSIGDNTVYFDEPITGVRADDTLGFVIKQSAGNCQSYETTGAPINDLGTLKTRWLLDAEDAYSKFNIGDTYTINDSNSGVMVQASPVALNPRVAIIGSSIAEGSPINFGYWYNDTTKDRLGAYIQVCHQALGNSFINLANGGASNTMALALSSDLPRADAFNPNIIHVQAMHNDIAAEVTWASYKASLLGIWEDCRDKGRLLIVDGPTPWNGRSAETIAIFAEWRVLLRTLCQDYHIPNPNPMLALGNDADMTFLRTDYVEADGIHPSALGCQFAGAATAEYLKNWIK
jgi:hypothetical protein